MNPDEKDMEITLPLLQTIEAQHDISQRKLAERLGVALGLANSFIKHCVRKGLIKVEQVPANRYFYYLTPQGFAEKSRLTAKYLSNSFKFYRAASKAYQASYQDCLNQGWARVFLCGVSELAEIALLQAIRLGIEVEGIFDPEYKDLSFLEKPVHRNTTELYQGSVYIVTSVDHCYRDQLLAVTDAKRIIQPALFD